MTWIIKFALRDALAQKRWLLIVVMSIMTGTAALVALWSFSENTRLAIDDQALSVMGADFQLQSRLVFSPELEKILSEIPGERATEIRLFTMMNVLKSENTRMIQLRALDDNFPFYGEIKTEPENLREGLETGDTVLLDEALFYLFDLEIGDRVKIGYQEFSILGIIKNIPGESGVFSQLAPRALISHKSLKATKLLGFGSRAFYRSFHKLPAGVDPETIRQSLSKFEHSEGISIQTLNSKKKELGKRLERTFQFLNLMAFAALLLGAVGIASVITVYMDRRIREIALLRCIGATQGNVFFIYLIQMLVFSVIGSVVGAALGVAFQHLLPVVLKDLMPFSVAIIVSWKYVIAGIAVSIIISMLFTLIPLFSTMNITPMAVMRSSVEKQPIRLWLRGLIYLAISAFIMGFIFTQMQDRDIALKIGLSSIAVFIILFLVAKLFMWALRRLIHDSLPFSLRLGLSNLYRPYNQTTALILSLGVGSFFILSLFYSKQILLGQMNRSQSAEHSNMILFDIQVDQISEVESILKKQGLEVQSKVPIVTMRISKINGKSIDELRRGKFANKRERWTLNREYRSTYRSYLQDSEKLIKGKFISEWSSEDGVIPISIEEGIAQKLKVELEDSISFDLQGLIINCKIASIRTVDWYKMEPNFFIVFPDKILQDAPQIQVIGTRVKGVRESAALQKAVVSKLPNVSLLDLRVILEAFESIFSKMSFAVNFLAFLSIITGFIILISSVAVSQLQRSREMTILKVIGASQNLLVKVLLIEYLAIGILAALVSNGLAVLASFYIARKVFESNFQLDTMSILIGFFALPVALLFVGAINAWHILRRRSLPVLREEN